MRDKIHKKQARHLLLVSSQVSFFWLFLTMWDFALFKWVPDTSLNTIELSKEVGFLFAFSDFLLLFFFLFIILTPVLLFKNKCKKNLFSCLLFLVILFINSIFFLSWSLFYSSKFFLGIDSFSFFYSNKLQVLQHLTHTDHISIFLIPAIVVLITFVVYFFINKILKKNRKISIFLILASISFFIITISKTHFNLPELFTYHGAIIEDHAGAVSTERDRIQEYLENRSGPMMYLWAELKRKYFLGDDPILNARGKTFDFNGESILNRNIITLRKYREGVDFNKFRNFNVIIVLIESLRSDQLLVGGSRLEILPNLEEVASDSLIFTNHYSQASHSNYADLAALSSHYPLRSVRPYIYPEEPSYPRVLIYDILKKLGYRTAIISSQNENWGKMINYLQTGNIDFFFHSDTFDGPTYIPYNDTGFEAFVKGKKRSGKIDDRFTVAEAIRWIDEDPGSPFFIYLNLQNSHIPYQIPADFPRRFGPKSIDFSLRFNNFPPQKAKIVKQLYADSLAYVDYQLGKLIVYLKANGLWDTTILAFTGDTGQAFYEHGFAAHANKLFNEVMRVPLVISAPELPHIVDNRLSQHIDLAPTILDLLGLPSHPSFQGDSLLGPAPPERSVYLVAQTPLAHQYAIVQKGYKYIYDANLKRGILFNLKVDPRETKNIERLNPEKTNMLAKRLHVWRRKQIDYYRNVSQHSIYYPPILID